MKKTFAILFFFLSIFHSLSQEEHDFVNIQNLDINTVYADFGVTIYNGNHVLFASSMKDRTIRRRERSHNRMEYLKFYKGNITENGQIINKQKYSSEKFNMFYESDITFDKDGKTIYFTLNNYIKDEYRKQFKKSNKDTHILNIFKATIDENGIATDITSLPFNGKDYSISHPRLSPDGKTLFFISNMESSYGGTDIYKVTISENGEYSEPENLGPKINSEGNEMFPFLSSDNVFYFSSDGHKGKGGLDIFSSELINREFYSPINVKKINAEYDDFAFVISPELNIGYFSTVRKGNVGDADIYSFNIKPIECNQIIAGILTNTKTGEILVNAEIELYANGKLIESTKSSKKGTYQFATNCDTDYNIKVAKSDFIQVEKNHTSSKINNETTEINFELEPIECNQTIAGIITNTRTGEILINAEIELYTKGKLIESTRSTEKGTYQFLATCETDYSIKVAKSDFIQVEKDYSTSKINNETTEIDFELEPKECYQTIAGIITNIKTGKILVNTEIGLYINEKLIESTTSTEKGTYQFATICETDYSIKVTKTNFMQVEKDYSTSKINNETYEINFELEPIECNQTIVGIVIDEESKLPLANAEVTLTKNGVLIKKIITKAGGAFNFEEFLDCKSQYKVSTTLNLYNPKYETINTDSKIGKETSFNIYLAKIEVAEELITVNDVVMIKTNPIYFDLNKSDIRRDAAIELNKVVKFMRANPSIKIELNSHTDSRAPDAYNMRLSNERASSSIAYIISQGIDSSRISGKGYGETRLVNECSNGVKCTSAQHEENRRTEFIVIKE